MYIYIYIHIYILIYIYTNVHRYMSFICAVQRKGMVTMCRLPQFLGRFCKPAPQFVKAT